MNALDESAQQDLHYSSIMSISESAAEQIRALILKAIEDSEPVIKEAKDEEVYALCIDLFGLKSG